MQISTLKSQLQLFIYYTGVISVDTNSLVKFIAKLQFFKENADTQLQLKCQKSKDSCISDDQIYSNFRNIGAT